MKHVKIEAGTVTASREDRVFSGLLLPYGEQGRTNIGRFTVEAGAVTIPEDLSTIIGNLDHERESPASNALTLVETPAGIVVSGRANRNPEGDTLLAELTDPNVPNARRKLSIEMSDAVVEGGKLVSARLFGYGHVPAGAFPSATVLAADVGEGEEIVEVEPVEEDDDEAVTTEERHEDTYIDGDGNTIVTTTVITRLITDDKTTSTTVETTENKGPEGAEEDTETMGPKATAPAAVLASAARRNAPQGPTDQPTFRQVMRALTLRAAGNADRTVLATLDQAGQGGSASTIFAALSDIAYNKTATDPGKVINPFPQWIGELWSGLVFERDVVDVFGSPSPLTAATIGGWSWDVKPEGGDWAGNKSPIPTNTPKAKPYNEKADYFAGGHDHANEYRHFSNEEYWTAYNEAMRESYGKWSNDKAWGYLAGAATALEGDVVPDGIATGLSLLIDGAVAVVEANALPSFAFVEPTLWKHMLKTSNLDVLGYLDAQLGFKSGTLADGGFTLRPRAGQTGVMVGAKEAVSLYELPGVPLRVEAEDITKGGLDTGLFGYFGKVIHKADALVQVNARAAAPAV
jgi:hypothetical protein